MGVYAGCNGLAEHIAIDRQRATFLLGTMLGGYNIMPLVDLLDDHELAPLVAEELKGTLLMFDAFHDVAEKAKNGNVVLHLNKTLEEVVGDNMGVTGVRVKDTESSEISEIEAMGVFIAIGHSPNTGIFDGELASKSFEHVADKAPNVDAYLANGMCNFRRAKDGLPQRFVSLERDLARSTPSSIRP